MLPRHQTASRNLILTRIQTLTHRNTEILLLFGNTFALKVLFTQSFYHGSYLIYEHFYFLQSTDSTATTPLVHLLRSLATTPKFAFRNANTITSS